MTIRYIVNTTALDHRTALNHSVHKYFPQSGLELKAQRFKGQGHRTVSGVGIQAYWEFVDYIPDPDRQTVRRPLLSGFVCFLPFSGK